MISSIVFVILLGITAFVFVRRLREIRYNINLGKPLDLAGNVSERLKIMARVALGQGKLLTRPLAGVLHVLIYAGFIIINIEILEIIIDGAFGTHRFLSQIIGFGTYQVFIGMFEILALLVIVACVVFLVRRNVGAVKRLSGVEMTKWPKSDANIILIVEISLMMAFLVMNAADSILLSHAPHVLLASQGLDHYIGFQFDNWFWISGYLTGLMPNKISTLFYIERFCWWYHITGVMGFSIYVLYSKHFHIFIAFPNTYFTPLKPMGELDNLAAVKSEVGLMMDPNADPYAAPPEDTGLPKRFGAKDVTDLTWKNLMDAYSCTECGRCTSECPANQTGKLLSPRKIMMDTRDRLEEIGCHKRKNGVEAEDGKSLLGDYISNEELWACTTCNACVNACPVNINPLSIIVDLRRFLVMEESAAPNELNTMFTNVENNAAPWQFAQADRANWASEE